jgi:hypothetical protein
VSKAAAARRPGNLASGFSPRRDPATFQTSWGTPIQIFLYQHASTLVPGIELAPFFAEPG